METDEWGRYNMVVSERVSESRTSCVALGTDTGGLLGGPFEDLLCERRDERADVGHHPDSL